MSRKSGKSQAAVERLLEERRQYEAWIRKLAEPGSTGMPPHVVDRVRSDYRGRLEDVTRQLARHETELATSLAELEQRRDEMKTQRRLREEALAEVRLRHTVGEFDDAQYAELSADHTAFIAQLAEELETTERDIGRLQEVLSLVTGGMPGAAEAPAADAEAEVAEAAGPVEEAEVAETAPEREVVPAPEAAPPPPQPVRAAAPAVEAIAPPEPAIPTPRKSGPVRAPAIAPPPAEHAKAPMRQSALDELAFIRSVAEPPKGEPVEEAAEPVPPTAPAAAEPPPAPPASQVPGENPLVPVQHLTLGEPEGPPPTLEKRPTHVASRGSEQQTARPHERPSEAEPAAKTLRCAECGTANLPTEWYCEKCGAELSAF